MASTTAGSTTITASTSTSTNDPGSLYYYYQNPQTGTVSTTPLSVDQLIRLLVPARANIPPILPSTTQVLEVTPQQQQQQQQEDSYGNSSSFGQWKSVSEVDILKEASCQHWYVTIPASSSSTTATEVATEGSSQSSSSSPEGPCSSRRLFELISQSTKPTNESMVYAQGISPEWTVTSKLPNLTYLLTALQNQKEEQQNLLNNEFKDNKQHGDENANEDKQYSKQVHDDLEAFLKSTEDAGEHDNNEEDDNNGQNNTNDTHINRNGNLADQNNQSNHTKVDDDGTRYLRDPLTGNWVHEGLAMKDNTSSDTKKPNNQGTITQDQSKSQGDVSSLTKKKKKKKKSQFSKRNAKLWVYVSGLPTSYNDDGAEIDVNDIQRYFSKAGLFDLDPHTLQPKIKLYRDHTTGRLKGDASICYARPESVELALQILNGSAWDEHHTIKVERAHFEAKPQHGDRSQDNDNDDNGSKNTDDQSTIDNDSNSRNKKRKNDVRIIQDTRRPVSEAQRKVARLALLQAQDDGFGERLAGGRKGLRIIVIKNIMDGIDESQLEETLYDICNKFGDVEKITCISRTGVVIVKFVEPLAASSAIAALNGTPNPRLSNDTANKNMRKIEAIYWDGVTDYTTLPGDDIAQLEDEKKRHDDFGSWLDSQQELPPELQLQVAPADDEKVE